MNHFLFDEIVEKETAAEFQVVITDEMMKAFYEISGDDNPMHMDSDYAKARGYADRIVYGMLTASFYSKLVGVYLPGEYCLLQEVETSFYNPVYVGDVLTVSGVVAEKNEAVRRLVVKAKIVDQNGKRISKAEIKVGCLM